MRIFTRGENQSLLIDQDITLTVLGVYPDHVRLAISAPRSSPTYWETDLYLPEGIDLESIELELSRT